MHVLTTAPSDRSLACTCSPRRPPLSPQVRALLGLPQHIRQEDGTREAFERVLQRFDVDYSKGIEMDEFMRVFADEGRVKSLEALDAMLAQPELAETSASSTSSARAPSVVRPRDPPSIGCSQQ